MTDTYHGPNSCRVTLIRFDNAWDVILLKSVLLFNTHIEEHSTAQQKFEESLKLFMANAPSTVLDRLQHLTC